MKMKVILLSGAVGVAILHSARAADVTVLAGETLTVTDFASVSYGGIVCASNEIVTLNEGSAIKVAAGVTNAANRFVQYIKLLGNATLDLSDYDAGPPFHLFTGVYTEQPDSFALTVVNAPDKRFRLGGRGSFTTSDTLDNACVVSAGALSLPDDTELHLWGQTCFHRFPTNVTNVIYDLNSAVASTAEGYQPTVTLLGKDAFGTEPRTLLVSNFQMVVASGAISSNQCVRVAKASRGSLWGGGHYFKPVRIFQSTIRQVSMTGSAGFTNDVELAGGRIFARGTTPTLVGSTTGYGTIHTMGWGQVLNLGGELNAADVSFALGQRGSWICLKYSRIEQPIGTLDLSHSDNVGNASYMGGSHGYRFQLEGYDAHETVVPIRTLSATTVKNNLGATICVYGRQSVNVGTLTGNTDIASGGGLRIVDSNSGYTQFTVGSMEKSVELLLSTNTHFTVTNMTASLKPCFNYYLDGFNRTTLDFVNGSTAAAVVKGGTPSTLPRRIRGHHGTLAVGDGMTAPNWTVSINPSDADPVLDGCEGSGALTVPASGTIRVANTTGGSLARGLYPILTCTSGGAALSAEAWPVALTGWCQGNLEVVRGDTGVWLRVSSGTLVIVR